YAGRLHLEGGPLQGRFQRVWDDRVEQAAHAWLDGVDRSRPFALWVHFYDVHRPYSPPAEHAQRYGWREDLPDALSGEGPDAGVRIDDHLDAITLGDRPVPAEELARIRGLYDAGITATDARLGRLLSRLEELGEL